MAAGFRRLDERIVYKGRVVTVGIGEFESPAAERFERDVVHHPGAVCVVPLLENGEVVLVRQYRPPLDAEMLELPAGLRDVAGEDPRIAAARELEEETGYRAGVIEPLCVFHNSPGFSDEEVHIFRATDLVLATPDRQGVEERHMEIELVRLEETRMLVAQGRITDAKTIIGLTLTLLDRS
ncbi:MAG: NUDIX hydrolase [Acidimicrobiales bacterium]|nr:NUDIX hydrolase [Acidimicrobiales bacterium]